MAPPWPPSAPPPLLAKAGTANIIKTIVIGMTYLAALGWRSTSRVSIELGLFADCICEWRGTGLGPAYCQVSGDYTLCFAAGKGKIEILRRLVCEIVCYITG